MISIDGHLFRRYNKVRIFCEVDSMKYLVLLCDGMADTPVPELGFKTPM